MNDSPASPVIAEKLTAGGTTGDDGSGPVSGPRGVFHPYVQLLVSAVLVTAAELLLKTGATKTAGAMGTTDWTGFTLLISPWVWAGILCYVLSLVSWLHLLRFVPLIVAFNLMNTVHVLVPLGAWVFLGEQVPVVRLVGIGLILSGVLVLAGPLASLESKLEEQL